MRSKLLLCLALVLSGLFATQCAYGFVAEIQINHANLKTYCPVVTIKTTRPNWTNDEVVFFTVIVFPKDKQRSDHFSGRLEISDTDVGKHFFIALTMVEPRKYLGLLNEEVPKSLQDKCIKFEFGVAVKYLQTSEFRVEETYGGPDGAPTDYIFNLKEFADEK